MPIPKPNKDESRSDFMARCMSNPTMNTEYPDQAQRAAICNQSWRDKKDIAPELNKTHRKLLNDIEFASDASLSEKRQIVVTAASGKSDRSGDIVKVDGIDLENFKKNPIILWAHDHYGLPVAKAVDMVVEKGKLVMTLEFATAEMYAFADTVYKLVKGGFLKGVSIGARVLDAEWIVDDNEEIIGRKFNKLELLELSIVPIPADSKALITAVKSGAISCEDMEECLAKSFDAPLDFPTQNPVESTTVEENTVDIYLEARIKSLEEKLSSLSTQSDDAKKLASSVESVMQLLISKMGTVTTQPISGQPMNQVVELLESISRKVQR